MFQIVNRKINYSEANFIIKNIKQTPNIMGYSSKEWIASEHIMIAEDENQNIVGVCLNYDFHEDWCKIAALFVLKDYRGLGLGKSLFYQSYNNAIERGKNIYTISANPIVLKMMKELDFLTVEKLNHVPNKYKNIFYLHTIKWIINLFRIKEILRKKLIFGDSKDFLYGLKIIK